MEVLPEFDSEALKGIAKLVGLTESTNLQDKDEMLTVTRKAVSLTNQLVSSRQ